jgi:multidrug resistance efflux pump
MNDHPEHTGTATEQSAQQNGRQQSYEPMAVRSDEATELLERTPSWILRWGVTVLIGVFVLVAIVAILVKYPDTLEGRAVVSTDPLPIKLKAANSGRLARLFIADNKTVAANTPVAEIENHTGFDNIMLLQQYADSTAGYMTSGNDSALARMLNTPLFTLGEAQSFYNQLLQNIGAYLLLKKEQLYKKRIGNLQQQISRYNTTMNISSQQTELEQEELKQYNERFRANEQLYRDKVISRNEYFEEAARLRQKRIALEERNKNAVQGNITISDYRKQLLDMEYDREEKDRELRTGIMESIRNIRNYIQTWKIQYLLVAPYRGQVHYLRTLQQNEMINAGEELFAVAPENAHYNAHISIPATGIGKVKKGQIVHILLDKYPYNEYGYLEGKVNNISALPEAADNNNNTPDQQTYHIDVRLPDSLVTSYHIPIPVSPEMGGQGRIITKDMNLLQRLVAGASKVNK